MASDPTRPVQKIVVLGGGFGGLEAVRRLAGARADVTLVDARNHHLFQPLLYQVATAALSPADIAVPIRRIVARQKNVRVVLARALEVDREGKRVHLETGSIDYDWLVLAVGSRSTWYGHEAEWARHAPSLKNLGDAVEIRSRILAAFEAAEREPDARRRERLLTFVVVGGGPTGVELAGAMAEIARHTLRGEFRSIDPARARVLLVEALDRVLPTFDPESS
ncbi:MAG TPA: FAD-dependent oxidoreductase, partial [Planctomycetota bacterium]|nr:FAD-dependent oxidoreductase [Planctomycetota bacterium]